MKIGCIGDLHISSVAPERRLDKDYLTTCIGKLSQCFDILHDCNIVLQAGDFFDSYQASKKTIAAVISTILDRKQMLFGVSGQHDQCAHSMSTYPNSPLNVLQAARAFYLADVDPIKHVWEGKETHIYGASFGQPVPQVVNKDIYNVLMIHAMIGDRPLFPGQELESPRAFLRKYPDYKLILAGDFHYRFIDSLDGRLIVNAGAVMRKTIADIDHKPAVLIVDTDTQTVETRELSVAPAFEVFDLTAHDKKSNQDLEALIAKIKNSKSVSVGWKNILLSVLNESGATEEIRELAGVYLGE